MGEEEERNMEDRDLADLGMNSKYGPDTFIHVRKFLKISEK